VGSHDAENKAIIKDAVQLGKLCLRKDEEWESDVVGRVLR
jgi:hypothetical protein